MRKQFENSCNWYLRFFCKKHELQYAGAYWVGDNVGGIVEVSDYFINFSDIMYDIDNDVPFEQFFAWKDYEERVRSIEFEFQMQNLDISLRHITYRDWCNGKPRPYSDAELGEIEEAISVLMRLVL